MLWKLLIPISPGWTSTRQRRWNPKSTDTIWVEWSGSTLADSGGTVIIGGSGTGELDIKDAGTVTDGSTAKIPVSAVRLTSRDRDPACKTRET